MIRRLILSFLFCWLTAGSLHAAREVVVLVVTEGVSVDRFAAWSEKHRDLLQAGAFGLMNNRTGDLPGVESNAITIGAGTHALGISEPTSSRPVAESFAYRGFNAGEITDGETAGIIFQRNTGYVVPDTAVVHLGLVQLQQINSELRYPIIPGLLGQRLQDAGVCVVVYGNADRGSVPVRYAAAIAMNAQGWVPAGDVSRDILLPDAGRPYGVRLDYPRILAAIRALPDGRHFVVVDAGDGARADAAGPSMAPRQAERATRLALAECLQFTKALNGHLRRDTDHYRIIFAGITTGAEAASRGDLLTPVLVTGDGVQSGMLYSATTQRTPLCANVDLSATVLAFFGLPAPAAMRGSPLEISPGQWTMDRVQVLDRQIVATYIARAPVLFGFIAVVAISAIIAILALIVASIPSLSERVRAFTSVLRPALLALMLVPFTLLITPLLHIYAEVPSVIFTIAFTVAAGYLLHARVRDQQVIFGLIGTVTAGSLCLDLVLGGYLLKQSLLSYDPIIGFRYYGLGNEYSGVLIGAAMLGIFAWLDRAAPFRARHLAVLIAAYIALFVIIGYPRFGADFGGMLAAIPGFGFALVKAQRREWQWKTLAGFAVGGTGLLVLVLALDMLQGSSHRSHIGQAFDQAFAHGPGVLIDAATRKWALNLHLLGVSRWTYALISLIIAQVLLFYRPVGVVKSVLAKHPLLNAGFIGILAGMIVAFFANDSGIIMAATGLLYLTLPLLMMVQVEIYGNRTAVDETLSQALSRTNRSPGRTVDKVRD